ncbi:MAG TPA: hypothetical protein VGM23_02635 [Armatimonadota bacterium]|jgi:hypothetical protein
MSYTTSLPTEVQVGQVSIELLLENGLLRGLGTIRVNGVPLRSAAAPMRPDIQTPDGIRYESFRLDEVRVEGEETVLVTTALGTAGLFGEYRDEYDNILAWPHLPREIADRVEWRLKPETLTLDGVDYAGFSYALRFHSAERPIHKVTWAATWELGGAATGNTLLYQGQVNPPVYTCTKESSFTTACWRKLGEIGKPEDYSFQFCSRYSPHQCCDFQYGPQGSLFAYWPDIVDVHSVVQKNPGEDVVFVLDKCLLPLNTTNDFPRKCVLFAPAPPEGPREHLMHDRWLAAWQHAQRCILDPYQVVTPYVLPEAGTPYHTSLDAQGKLCMSVKDTPCPPERILYTWAEEFPALAKLGIRRIFPEVIAESDISENGYTYKLMTGIHGDLITSSVCQIWRYQPAEFWGGWPAWEHFYQAGHAVGIEVGHWIGMHLSPHAPILQQHPEFVCRDVNTRPHGGGYMINLSYGINFHTAADWLLEQFAEWKRHGLDYLFFDSFGNMGMMGVDFSAKMQGNAAAIVRFIGELNKLGIRAVSVEGISPLGVGHFGMSDNMTENRSAPEGICGQNDWSWWVEHEDMLVDCTPCAMPHADRTPEELREQCFRALANRALLIFLGFEDAEQWPRNLQRWSYFYQTFNTLRPLMVKRQLLPDRRGVRWTSPAGEALFAYRAFPHPLPAGARVERIVGEECTPLPCQDVLQTEALTAYRITLR